MILLLQKLNFFQQLINLLFWLIYCLYLFIEEIFAVIQFSIFPGQLFLKVLNNVYILELCCLLLVWFEQKSLVFERDSLYFNLQFVDLFEGLISWTGWRWLKFTISSLKGRTGIFHPIDVGWQPTYCVLQVLSSMFFLFPHVLKLSALLSHPIQLKPGIVDLHTSVLEFVL